MKNKLQAQEHLNFSHVATLSDQDRRTEFYYCVTTAVRHQTTGQNDNKEEEAKEEEGSAIVMT